MRRAAFAVLLTLAGCGRAHADEARNPGGFPQADRPVSPVVSSRWSTEAMRDSKREAGEVMDKAGIAPGMTVADIGAGEGYYTVRLAQRVGPRGRVLAQDVVPAYRDQLAMRVARERLDNVAVKLGSPADPKLPERSFDRVLMIHMYHEIAEPYEFLWRLWPALKPGGLVVVVDAERLTGAHGTPSRLLECEFRAAGYRLVSHRAMPQADGYLALFAPLPSRPEPRTMRACRLSGSGSA